MYIIKERMAPTGIYIYIYLPSISGILGNAVCACI